MEVVVLTPLERERAEYGLYTLKQLHDQLKNMPGDQFKKYPRELSWIKWEIEREENMEVTVLREYLNVEVR
jgi:hypothetical protein